MSDKIELPPEVEAAIARVVDGAKRITDGTGPGLYITHYLKRDGRRCVGPEINATCRAEADRIVARLSYGGQPLTIDGLLVEEFPVEWADQGKRAAVKSKIDDELRRELQGKK